MLRIRLSRVGKKKQPSYRMVVADSRAPRDGAFVKIIGHYNPLTDPATLVVKEDEAVYWLQKGAKPSETAAKLLTRLGVMEKAGLEPYIYKGPDVPPGKKGKDGEEPPAASAPAAETPAASAPAAEAPAEEPAAEAPAEEPAAEAPAEEPAAEAPAEEPAAEAPTKEPAAKAEPESKSDESAEEPAQTDASDGDDTAEAEDKTAPTE